MDAIETAVAIAVMIICLIGGFWLGRGSTAQDCENYGATVIGMKKFECKETAK